MNTIIQIRRLRTRDINELIQTVNRKIGSQVQSNMTQTHCLFSTQYHNPSARLITLYEQ